MQRKSRMLVLCSFFAALIAVCAQIQVPTPYVPVNLALFAVYLAGALLGPLYGGISTLVYLIMAMVGVPVLAGLRGGLGTLVGPTGGYAVGYFVVAVVTGIGRRYWGMGFWKISISIVIGTVLCYILGTGWFMIVSGSSLAASLAYCIWPFIPGDLLKIGLAAGLSLRLRRFCP